jgi:hypothetical protein
MLQLRRPTPLAVAALLLARPRFEPMFPTAWRPIGGLRALFYRQLLRREPGIHLRGGGNRLNSAWAAPTLADFYAIALVPGRAPRSLDVCARSLRGQWSSATTAVICQYACRSLHMTRTCYALYLRKSASDWIVPKETVSQKGATRRFQKGRGDIHDFLGANSHLVTLASATPRSLIDRLNGSFEPFRVLPINS